MPTLLNRFGLTRLDDRRFRVLARLEESRGGGASPFPDPSSRFLTKSKSIASACGLDEARVAGVVVVRRVLVTSNNSNSPTVALERSSTLRSERVWTRLNDALQNKSVVRPDRYQI